jgi:hypothetical protein
MYTLKAVSKNLEVPYSTLWQWVDVGHIPHIKVDNRKFLDKAGVKVARQLAAAYQIKSKAKLGEEMNESEKCILCDRPIVGYGNNARPLADGDCCDECNHRVLAARMAAFLNQETRDVKKERVQ